MGPSFTQEIPGLHLCKLSPFILFWVTGVASLWSIRRLLWTLASILSAVRLSVVRPSVVRPSVVRLSAVRPSVIRSSFVGPSVVGPSVVRPSVVRPSLPLTSRRVWPFTPSILFSPVLARLIVPLLISTLLTPSTLMTVISVVIRSLWLVFVRARILTFVPSVSTVSLILVAL